MRLSEGSDSFDQRAIMDADISSVGKDHDFEFAFNSSNFSDRVLRIEIMADPPGGKSDGETCSSIAEWRKRKRRRADIKRDEVFAACGSEQILNLNLPDLDEGLAGDNPEEPTAMLEESQSAVDESGHESDSSWSMDCSTILRVKSIYISSAILAAKSPFFYKLFSNGMRESDQRHATLRIHSSEEAALMELLSYMYSGKLTTNDSHAVLDVLMAADKFEVASCMRHCSKLLRNLPMTPESALLYLELPSSVSMASAVQPLTDAARDYLAARYKDVSKFQDEVVSLPLAGIEAVLSSDELQVASEDVIYDLVLRWTRAQSVRAEERREMLAQRLARLVRFPFMTCRKLRKVLSCPDLDHDLATKLVMEALFFKAETPHRQRALAQEDAAAGPSSARRFTERAYKYRPVKVVEFEHPHVQCIVYLDLRREECANLFPAGRVYSQAFHLGGQGFFLSAHCSMDQQSSFHCFGLFLGMQEKGSVSFTVDYEFAARTRPVGDFLSKYRGFYTFTGGKAVGYRNLFAIPWASFMADDSPYFVDGILHLRAELTIKHPSSVPPPAPH